MKIYTAVQIILVSVFMASCTLFQKNHTEPNELEYMRNIEEVAVDASHRQVTTLQSGDHILIMVSAADQDVAKIFNQNYSSQEQVRRSTMPGGNIIATPQTTVGPTYIVDSEGYIDFPVVGKVYAKDKTIETFTEDLKSDIKRYIKNPQVQARISNYKVTVLGEVRNPGQYVIADGRTTLLNALGLAGDLTVFGQRKDVLLVRNVGGEISKHRIDLTSADFINSPYYELKQGDVIYVTPNRTQERVSKRDPNLGAYISAVSVLVAIVTLLIRR